ncbi:MAG: DNA-3-methyladenine glycosylase 2 family protein [Deltaproteobacteria bacterium]|nr:MAG: DNA-3-methyladenine glycosylase 2 family protein [Deltaproteobacteria bacterium]
MLSSEICYRAVQSKDTRFDGVFYVGVQTTGIYCRPVCPARTPAQKNCTFFKHAAEAEQAGYRACFRCRPELAPGESSVDASSRLAQRAMSFIQEGFLNSHSVHDLADKLKVTSRHLRRTLNQEVGATPQQLAQSKRLALAKQLLHETSLSLTDVAFASGFSSVRRFNDQFQKTLGCTPSSLRRTSSPNEDDAITLRLDYRPPLAWEFLLDYLRDRVMQGVEEIDGYVYRRTVRWNQHVGWLSVEKYKHRNSLKMKLPTVLLEGAMPILSRVRQMFDLDAHPEPIHSHLSKDPTLQRLVQQQPGLRIPGAFEKFPLLIRIVLGQRISVKAASTLCRRLIETFGEAVETPFASLNTTFPSPETLGACSLEDLTNLGILKSQAATIHTLSQQVASGELQLDDFMDLSELSSKLLKLRGIGPWTVEYIKMRGFGEPDAFPGSDLGLCKALQCTPTEANERSESWRPWRSYAAIYLWSHGG